MLTREIGWIDPCPIWTPDGKAYMVFAFAKSRAGINDVLALIEIDPGCRKTIGDYFVIFDGSLIAPISEGPKIYMRDGYYYILFPAGGVERGWQCCIRSRSIHGPYEYRVVMHQGRSPVTGPHQGGWITAPDGSDWFIHFQDVIELGRVIHLEPMRFMPDGWPVIGSDADGDGIGEPVPRWKEPVAHAPHYSIPVSDEFDGPSLSLQWQWQANPDASFYSLSERKGYIRMRCCRNPLRENLLWYAPNALTEIPQGDEFTIDASLELCGDKDGDFGGIGIIGHRYGYIGIYFENGSYSIRSYYGKVKEKTFAGLAEEELVQKEIIPEGQAYLRIEVRKDRNYFLSYSLDGEDYRMIDRIFTLERATWTGAKPMLWASNRLNAESEGYADFDYFRLS